MMDWNDVIFMPIDHYDLAYEIALRMYEDNYSIFLDEFKLL